MADSTRVRVLGEGPPDARLMIVGEAWGEKEEHAGRPFVGISGQELDRYLSSIRIPRSACYVTNVVNERPPNNSDPTPALIAAHSARLREELLMVQPQYVVTLGRYSTRAFLGPDASMDREWGIGHPVYLCGNHALSVCAECHGENYMLLCVVPIYHPAYGLYMPEDQCLIQTGFEGFPGTPWGLRPIIDGKVAAHPPQDRYPDTTYREITDADVLGPGADALPTAFAFDKYVAVDTEGSATRPWCLSFAWVPGIAYVIRADQTAALQAFNNRLAETGATCIMHYAAHDLVVLAAMDVYPTQIADTMLIDYLLGPMFAQALKPSAYRLLGMRLRDYEDLTHDADRQLAVAYLQRVLDEQRCEACHGRGERSIRIPAFTIPAHTKTVNTKRGAANRRIKAKVVAPHYEFGKCGTCSGDGTSWPTPRPLPVWENGKLSMWQPTSIGRRVRKILHDVASGKANKDGEPTDPRRRWENTDPPDVIEHVTRALGPMPHATLDMVPLQAAIDYACADADATLRKWLMLDPMIDEWQLRDVYNTDLSVIPMLVKMQQTGMEVDTEYFAALSAEWRAEKARIAHRLQRLVGYYVNPGSSKQVANLLFAKLHLPPVKLTRSKENESTDDKVLEQLSATLPPSTIGYKAVELIKQHRKIDKLDGTYAGPLSLVDADDERVRMEFKYTRTATGRLSSAKPRGSRQHRRNYIQGQNIPTREEEGKRIRHGFVARPGYKFGSWDLSQIEWRVMAHLSADANLLRVFRQGLDMHKMTASLIWQIAIDAVTAEQRQSAKNIGFGMGYKITGHGLRAQFAQRGIIITKEEGDAFIAAFMAAYPGIAEFWEETFMQARRTGYVRSPSGRIRWVSAIRSTASWVREEAERQAGNFPVQEYAAYIMKQVMRYWWERIRPALHASGIDAECLLQLHDDLVIEFPDGAEDIIDPLMRYAMSHCVKLSVPVMAEGKAGHRWDELVPLSEQSEQTA